MVTCLSSQSPGSLIFEVELPVPPRDSISSSSRSYLAPGGAPDVAVLVWGSQVFAVLPKTSDLPVDLDCEPVAISMHTEEQYALLDDGQVVTLGEPPRPFSPLKGLAVDQLHAGTNFLLVLTRDGDVYTWGLSLFGALGHGEVSEVSHPGQVALPGRARSAAVGPEHVLVYTEDNDLYGWGNNYYGQVQPDAAEVVPVPILIDPIGPLLCSKCTPVMSCGSDHSVAMCACCGKDSEQFKDAIVWGGQRRHSVSPERIKCSAESHLIRSLGSTSVVAGPSGSYVVFGFHSDGSGVVTGERSKDGYCLSDILIVPQYILLLHTVSASGKHRDHRECMQTDTWSFRPTNLPAKSWLERRRHRAQVVRDAWPFYSDYGFFRSRMSSREVSFAVGRRVLLEPSGRRRSSNSLR